MPRLDSNTVSSGSEAVQPSGCSGSVELHNFTRVSCRLRLNEAQGTTDDARSNLRRNGAVASAAERMITSRRQSEQNQLARDLLTWPYL
jgi:hypothetical protein